MNQPMTNDRMPAQIRTSRRLMLRGALGGAATAAFLAAGWSIDAAARPDYLNMGAPADRADEGPVSIIVIFNTPDHPATFEDYYLTTHVPLALRMPLLQRLESGQALSHIDGTAPGFYRLAILHFASHADLDHSLTSEEGITAFSDVANFATGGVTATIVRNVQTASPVAGDSRLIGWGVDPRER